MGEPSIKTYKEIQDVRCPYCGGQVNWKKFSHWANEQACFIAGCWSGSTLIDDTTEHIFKIWVTVDKEVFVTQKKEVEEA